MTGLVPLKASLRLSPTEAEAMRQQALTRWINLPNADLRVGRDKYEADIAAINALEEPMELLPCPFCSSTNIDPGGWASGPACNDCGASVGSVFNSLELNTAAWNRRTPDPKAQRLADALEAIDALCEDEIKARFGGSSTHTVEEVAKSSRIFSLLVVPRNIARAALAEWKP